MEINDMKNLFYDNKKVIWELWQEQNIAGTMYPEDFQREFENNENFREEFLSRTSDNIVGLVARAGKRRLEGGAKDRTKGKNNGGQGILNIFNRNDENSEEKQGFLAGWRERKAEGNGTDPTGGRTPGRLGNFLNTVGGLASGYLQNGQNTETTETTPPPPPAEEEKDNTLLIAGIAVVVLLVVVVFVMNGKK